MILSRQIDQHSLIYKGGQHAYHLPRLWQVRPVLGFDAGPWSFWSDSQAQPRLPEEARRGRQGGSADSFEAGRREARLRREGPPWQLRSPSRRVPAPFGDGRQSPRSTDDSVGSSVWSISSARTSSTRRAFPFMLNSRYENYFLEC